MRLLVNTASVLKGGAVQVASSFLHECNEVVEHDFGVILGPGLRNHIQKEQFGENFRFFELPYRPAQRLFLPTYAQSQLKNFESEFMPDVVFTTSGPSYWRPKAPHLMGFNIPHCLYLDSPYFSKKLGPLKRVRWLLKIQVTHYFTKHFADYWVVQTDDVNQRLQEWISSDHVVTVPNTIARFYEASAPRSTNRSDSPVVRHQNFRLLVLNSYYPHKDLELVDRIIDLMREKGFTDFRFTMTLPNSDFKKTISARNRNWVTNVGQVSPEECPQLYLQADAMLMPSLLECFSANYVEAMAMRCPIVATDMGFARTICADAASYFEPMNASSALEKILELRANGELRQRLVHHGERQLSRFGTSRTRAVSYLNICQRLVDERKKVGDSFRAANES